MWTSKIGNMLGTAAAKVTSLRIQPNCSDPSAEFSETGVGGRDGRKEGREDGREGRERGRVTDSTVVLLFYSLLVLQVLLKECEEARGGVASSSIMSHDLTDAGDISSSSQIISQQLVDFRNIEELQEQNQRLLKVVRELSEQNEEREKQTVEEQTRVS